MFGLENEQQSSQDQLTLSQAGDTSGGLGKNVGAAGAHDNGLGVREDGGDLDASLLSKIM